MYVVLEETGISNSSLLIDSFKLAWELTPVGLKRTHSAGSLVYWVPDTPFLDG